MARYIDVEKVHTPKGFFKDLNVPKLLYWLKSQPTADVVEVVRCKDCVAREKATLEPFVCSRNKMLVYNNSYCSYGKRKCEDGKV